MTKGTFRITVDRDGTPHFKRLMKTMTGNSQDIKYKQIDEDNFLITFYSEHAFDHVWDRWWEDTEWLRTDSVNLGKGRSD
jgi:hypothetical protein